MDRLLIYSLPYTAITILDSAIPSLFGKSFIRCLVSFTTSNTIAINIITNHFTSRLFLRSRRTTTIISHELQLLNLLSFMDLHQRPGIRSAVLTYFIIQCTCLVSAPRGGGAGSSRSSGCRWSVSLVARRDGHRRLCERGGLETRCSALMGWW